MQLEARPASGIYTCEERLRGYVPPLALRLSVAHHDSCLTRQGIKSIAFLDAAAALVCLQKAHVTVWSLKTCRQLWFYDMAAASLVTHPVLPLFAVVVTANDKSQAVQTYVVDDESVQPHAYAPWVLRSPLLGLAYIPVRGGKRSQFGGGWL